MVASSDDAHPSHVVKAPPYARGGDLLRAAAIYGANASGKSNLIKAMQFARDRILNGARPGQRIPVTPFRLSAAREKPSKFQFLFRLEDGTLYDYGFVLDDRRIHEEWLFGTPAKKSAKEQRYFERVTDEAGKITVEFGESLTGRTAREKQRFEFLAEGTRLNQLFFTECAERNTQEINSLHLWFFAGVMFVAADSVTTMLTPEDILGVQRLGLLDRFLTSAGVGQHSVSMGGKWIRNSSDIEPTPPPEESIAIWEQIQNLLPGQYLNSALPNGQQILIQRREDGITVQRTFSLNRQDDEGERVPFLPIEESDGTRRLLSLFPVLVSLFQTGGLVIIDEMDRRLHTLLTRACIEFAMSSDAAPNGQLIFTTHDTNLLDLDLLRRDEIWFVEKDERGASHLTSLAEFKIRPDLKVEKGYLQGRFGAIPYIGDLTRLLPNGDGAAAETEPAAAAAG
jgi:AAA15 family ATPase/GTPase